MRGGPGGRVGDRRRSRAARGAGRPPRVGLIDLTPAICPGRRCAPVIGGVLVYRDNQHLTASYAATLAPRLRSALDRILAPPAS
ncbi:SGNH hydrolase domain-containing protein [Plantactinospora veratri]